MDTSERPFFLLAEDEERNLLTVEGDGVTTIVERRAELLRGLLCGCISGCFQDLPCCILWRTCRGAPPVDKDNDKALQTVGSSRSEAWHTNPDFSGSWATRKRVWPRGFGPGWVIRTFAPLVLLGWSLILFNGLRHAMDLFGNLNGAVSAPAGSRSALAESAYLYNFKHAAQEDFLTNTMILIEARQGVTGGNATVLTPEIEQFSRTIQSAVTCANAGAGRCENQLDILRAVVRYDGYYMTPPGFVRTSTAPVFVNADASAMIIYIRHNFLHGLSSDIFQFFDEFLKVNGPNPARYLVRYTNEQKLLKIAQNEVVYDFEHADLIGIPFAWVILLWYCGSPAFLVLISLPICILSSFSLSVHWMPAGLALPTFAPSMIVSMAVALNVDYALFMLVRYSEELARGASRNFALDQAMNTAGKTIGVSGSIMLVSNGCLYFVKAETVASLGVALAITNLITIATNVTLLPALLCTAGPMLDTIRTWRRPSISGGVSAVMQQLKRLVCWSLSPCARCFRRVFGSGKRSSAIKILRHQQGEDGANELRIAGDGEDSDERTDDDDDAGVTAGDDRSSYGASRVLDQYFASDDLMASDGAQSRAQYYAAAGEDEVGVANAADRGDPSQPLLHDGVEDQGAISESHGFVSAAGLSGAPSTGSFGALVDGSSTVTSLASGVGGELRISVANDPVLGALGPPISATRTSERDRRRRAHAESSRILSAQSRVWAAIAKLCLAYPRVLIVFILALSAPVCWQIGRFSWTDSQANLVPRHNAYVETVGAILDAGFAAGYLSDYKAIVASPVSDTSKQPLTPDLCFDDNVGLEQLLKVASRFVPEAPVPPPGLDCSFVAAQLPGCEIPSDVLKRMPVAKGVLRNLCAQSCSHACRNELFVSKRFWGRLVNASETLLSITLQYDTMNSRLAGDKARRIKSIIESPALYLGRRYTWEDAGAILSGDLSIASSQRLREANLDDIDLMWRDKFHTMIALNGTTTATQALIRVHPPFQPYNEAAHPWINHMHDAMSAAGFNDKEEDFRFFFGGAAVRLFDQVDQVYTDTPPVMLTAVILTVLGTSVAVFQSLLLGPRLLLTIALTLGLVFGFIVLIFEDLKASPEAAGLYWIVPILGVPIMVGCTLDYDSFVVARIFEMRLASLSTEAAVFAGLQETGHVITIAGIIMTVAFGSMCLSAIPVVQQIGALLVACCLLDTFIVRSLLVPSLMLVAVELNWFPKKMPEVSVTMDMLRTAAASMRRRRRRQENRSSARD
ncbi:MmpL efflux pump, putative [Hondaea fermentalgiana]|uniref:MmpL efflux pump, putative n=1 Tax=Hondaea fermentalgiana TaxID=2315210 RepID=A0A2R5G4B3_9STRA|nr:MmpL efflux pump, putative [Hondaea fermentalgiana]|eukprot:GBG25149.1 MmpL efflux pump, putative [Hondaea fermentalgiana]